jgi:tRNA U34 5-methylaminomethyl-2-thiouridine-forming methyltransferase MnmC
VIKIIRTSDGSDTLYVPEIDEHYHSVHGAVQESKFIFINNGLNSIKTGSVRIFEVGFGTGLNALLSAEVSSRDNREIFYTSIEKYPLPENIINSLNYKEFVSENGKMIFSSIHSCIWNTPVKLSRNFTLLKIEGDLLTYDIDGRFDLIYFDAFGPDKQPELWTKEVFRRVADLTSPNGLLVTYSVKGEVKRALRENGFQVTLLPGPPGKRHILRAVKFKK